MKIVKLFGEPLVRTSRSCAIVFLPTLEPIGPWIGVARLDGELGCRGMFAAHLLVRVLCLRFPCLLRQPVVAVALTHFIILIFDAAIPQANNHDIQAILLASLGLNPTRTWGN